MADETKEYESDELKGYFDITKAVPLPLTYNRKVGTIYVSKRSMPEYAFKWCEGKEYGCVYGGVCSKQPFTTRVPANYKKHLTQRHYLTFEKRISTNPNPKPIPATLTQLGFTQKQFSMVKKAISNHIECDLEKPYSRQMHKRNGEPTYWDEDTVDYLESLQEQGLEWDIAVYILMTGHTKGVFSPGVIDDASGYLPNGLKLHTHSLFKLSLDRRDHSLPHFLREKPYDSNLRFVAFGINTHTNMVELFDGDVRAEIIRELETEIDWIQVSNTLENAQWQGRNMDGNRTRRRYFNKKEKNWIPQVARVGARSAREGSFLVTVKDSSGKMRKISKSIRKFGLLPAMAYVVERVRRIEKEIMDSRSNRAVYIENIFRKGVSSCWKRDEKICTKMFGTIEKFREYCFELLVSQHGLCEISGIRLRGNEAVGKEYGYRMSLDAIDPTKGHVKGNLRWVCAFLNSVNYDKVRKGGPRTPGLNEDPTAWTTEIFSQYFRIEEFKKVDTSGFFYKKRETKIVGTTETREGKWQAHVKKKGQRGGGYIGTFDTQRLAVIARNKFIENNETNSTWQDPMLASNVQKKIDKSDMFFKLRKREALLEQPFTFGFASHFKVPTKEHGSKYTWVQTRSKGKGKYVPPVSLAVSKYDRAPPGWKRIKMGTVKLVYFKYRNKDGKLFPSLPTAKKTWTEQEKMGMKAWARMACYNSILPYALRAYYFRRWFLMTAVKFTRNL